MDLYKINRDITLLAPVVQEKAAKALAECQGQGYSLQLFEGFRTPDRQMDLYAQGRTKPGKIVTKAKAWQSLHQYGLAIDTAFKVGGKWSWEGPWDKVIAIMQAYGFETLSWEKPHFQMSAGLTHQQMLQYATMHGLQALWIKVGAG